MRGAFICWLLVSCCFLAHPLVAQVASQQGQRSPTTKQGQRSPTTSKSLKALTPESSATTAGTQSPINSTKSSTNSIQSTITDTGSASSMVPTGPTTWRLQERVVTPLRRYVPQFEHPYTAYSLSAHELQNERLVRTLPEALKEVPGIMVQKTAHGHGSPYMRGFTGFRTLLLIDGIRLNNAVFRDGPNQYWNTVDHLAISRLEIVKGPSSVLYGSDAIGGTVNVITRERQRYKLDLEINPRAYYRFASAERSHIGRLEVSANWAQNIGMFGGFYYKNFGDLTAGYDTGQQPRTGYYELGGDIKFNWFLSEHAELVVAYYGLDQNNVWRTHKTIFARSFHNTTIGKEYRRRFNQEHHLGYVQLRLNDLDGIIQGAIFTTSWQYQHEKRDRLRADRRRDIQGFSVHTLGLQAQFESASPLGSLTYGCEYYRDFVASFRNDFKADGSLARRNLQGPVGDWATYDLLGIYLQDELTLFDCLTIVPGVRYTHAWVDIDEAVNPLTKGKMKLSANWGSLVGSLRVSLALSDHWRIFGGASQGFRTPNLSDLTRFDTARSNEIETPVRQLDPEYFVTYEVGVKANYADWYCQAAYYYTQIFDMIIRFPTGRQIEGNQEVTKDNAGDGFVHGVELQAGYNITSQWRIGGGFSWMEGIVATFPTASQDKEDEPIDRMQPAQGFLSLRWTHPSKRYWVEGVLHMVRHQRRLSTRDQADTQRIPPGGTPGYATITLRGGAQITDYSLITVSIENLGNVDYRVHGSGQNEAGTNFCLGLDIGL